MGRCFYPAAKHKSVTFRQLFCDWTSSSYGGNLNFFLSDNVCCQAGGNSQCNMRLNIRYHLLIKKQCSFFLFQLIKGSFHLVVFEMCHLQETLPSIHYN